MHPELSQTENRLVLSYIGIRKAIGSCGFALPILLGPIGWLIFGIEIQDNMSSYYHTALRDVFVGTMCAIGVFLYCYRGHDWIENMTAKLGFVSAFGIALFPLDANSDPLIQNSMVGYVHTLSGGVFFLTLAFYSLIHFPTSEANNEELEPHVAERNFAYRASGIVILICMLAIGTYMFIIPGSWKSWLNKYNFLFWMEWIAIWAFAAAWLTKGRVIVADIAIDLMSIPRKILTERKSDER